jgi:hypothetical protein
VRVKVELSMEAGFIPVLKEAETTWASGTPTAPLTGLVDMTVGPLSMTVSLPHPVTKRKSNAAIDPVR